MPTPPGDDEREAVRAALAHLAPSVLDGQSSEDLDAVRTVATAHVCRILVAIAAVETERLPRPGQWPTAEGVDAALEVVSGEYPGWLFDPPESWPVPKAREVPDGDRRRGVEALAECLQGTHEGETSGGEADPASFDLARTYEHLLALELDTDADAEGGGSDGKTVVLADDGGYRKATGSYYTPPAVVERTLRAALEPHLDGIGDRRSETAREAVLQLRVLDPAAGTGRFLVGAVDYLARAVADRGGEDTPDLRRQIAERCVYGVDRDPLAAELARASLWIHTGASELSVETGDALTGRGARRSGDGDGPAERSLDWSEAFPAVDDPDGNGRFDAVVGNPPYVRGRTLPREFRDHLRERYETASGAFDLYVPFVERAADLGERVALVVPNKWTTADYGRDLRVALLDRWGLESVVDLSALDVFPDADVYPVVVVCAPECDAEPVVRTPTVEGTRSVAVPTDLLDSLGGRVIPLDLDPRWVPRLRRILESCDRLGDHVRTTEGIHTGNARDRLVVEEPEGCCRRLADGRSIEPYRVSHSGEWIRYDPSLLEGEDAYADLRDPGLFETEKLLLRDISDRPVAAYDDRGLYALNTLYSVRSRPGSELPLRYLLAVFNSAFVREYFRSVYGGTHVRDGYLRFKPTFVEDLPVPAPDPDRLSPETRDRIREHPDTGTGVDDPDAVTGTLATLTECIEAAKSERAELSPQLDDHLGSYEPGPELGSLTGARVPTDAVETALTDTTRRRDGLRIGRVTVRERDGELVVCATARFKPESERETDRWGYAETDPTPALALDGGALDPDTRTLVAAYVPHAVGEDVRASATKTISPLDRLRSLRLPAPGDVRRGLASYRGATRRRATLERRIDEATGLIDRIVCDLYGLEADERAAL